MTSEKLYTINSTADFQSDFDSLPKKPKSKYTAYELVSLNYKNITKVLALGYTFTEIAELIFCKNGCKITGKEIKNHYTIIKDKMEQRTQRQKATKSANASSVKE